MGRMVDPRSFYYGKIYEGEVKDWAGNLNSWKNYKDQIFEEHSFQEYLKGLFESVSAWKLGFIFDKSEIQVKGEVVKISIFYYDGPIEDVLASLNTFTHKKRQNAASWIIFGRIRNYICRVCQKKLAWFEKLIVLASRSFYKRKCEVIFYKVDEATITSWVLVNYICIWLRQGYSLNETLVLVVRQLKKFLKLRKGQEAINGYWISCSGRYTRQQWAGFQVEKEGKLGVSSRSSYIDHSNWAVILKYGKCNVKVWLNKKVKKEKYSYKIIV